MKKSLFSGSEYCGREPLLDAHLHIATPDDVFKTPSLSSEIGAVYLNSTGINDWSSVDAAAGGRRSFSLKPFYGLHPWFTDKEDLPRGLLQEKLISQPEAGIGECGLDFSGKYRINRDRQVKIFETQLAAAVELRRPLSVHCVRAWEQLFKSIERFLPLLSPFFLHSFYGSTEVMKRLIKAGAFISLSMFSLRNPEKSFPVISEIPVERILVETDFIIGGADFSGEKHLAELKRNYMTVAEIKQLKIDEFIRRIWENGTLFADRETHRI